MTVYLFLSSYHLKVDTSYTAEKLSKCRTVFKFEWPNAMLNGKMASYSYHSLFDGGSDNNVFLYRFEVSVSDFKDWEKSDRGFRQIDGVTYVPDPRIKEIAPWWNPDIYPDDKVVLYEKKADNTISSHDELSLFFVNNNTNYCVYTYWRGYTR